MVEQEQNELFAQLTLESQRDPNFAERVTAFCNSNKPVKSDTTDTSLDLIDRHLRDSYTQDVEWLAEKLRPIIGDKADRQREVMLKVKDEGEFSKWFTPRSDKESINHRSFVCMVAKLFYSGFFLGPVGSVHVNLDMLSTILHERMQYLSVSSIKSYMSREDFPRLANYCRAICK